MHLRLDRYQSPLAEIWLVTDHEGTLRALDFADCETRVHQLLSNHYGQYEMQPGPAPRAVTDALDAYFDGELRALEHIRIATAGTPFQRAVWQALRRIAPGATKSYGEIAAEVGRPKASRAVGAANGANPIGIVVPCHRVIGSNGALTGYAGGVARKQWLLEHEATAYCTTMSTPKATSSAVSCSSDWY